jgi:DNA repair protein RadA/Sms
MPRTHSQWTCQQCGFTATKGYGRCPECGEWNSMVETVVTRAEERKSALATLAPRSAPQKISDVVTEGLTRLPVPMPELARVLGGGIVPGSLVLIGGEPGIGKSTLLLQMAATLAQSAGTVLYVSGEESVQQMKMRAERLGLKPDALYLLTETNLDEIIAHIERLAPKLVVIDSIQTVYLEELTSAAGSISQVRESAARLMHLAKETHIPIFLVGHVTKPAPSPVRACSSTSWIRSCIWKGNVSTRIACSVR